MQGMLRMLLILLCATGMSCVGAKKMGAAREQLRLIKESQNNEVSQVKQISSSSTTKLNENKIDSIINSRFEFRVKPIFIQMDSVGKEMDLLDSLMATKKGFRRAYKKVIVPKLALLDSFRQENLKRHQVYLMLEDGLNAASYTLFDLAAFFGPGKYAIPDEQMEAAANSFSPLIDSVIKFSEKYKNIPKKVTLVILGFADGTGFDPESDLYKELSNLIGKPDVSKEELNKKLSELRAETLIQQLRAQFIKRLDGKEETETLFFEYLGYGKGEKYPFNTVKDYREDDDRRRIVLCYWAVLPK